MTIHAKRRLSYASSGVNRIKRGASRRSIVRNLLRGSLSNSSGKPIELPFGLIFPSPTGSRYYYDLQIEGVGTKTLLAEVSGKYRSAGIDAVAMVVNDIIRSGAKPFLITDAIHIMKSNPLITRELVQGVMDGAKIAACVLASGETGDVPEILHSPIVKDSLPFDLMVSGVGSLQKEHVIWGKLAPGDEVIGLRSSGIHSNGLTLARKILLRKWGGLYDPWDTPQPLERTLIEELQEPTRIYVRALLEVQKYVRIKAAVHITGDGFGKFGRLLEWQPHVTGIEFDGLGKIPSIFRLIYETARKLKTPVSVKEMYQTFNMGYGFALVVRKEEVENALDRLNKHCQAEKMGQVNSSRAIRIAESQLDAKPVSLEARA